VFALGRASQARTARASRSRRATGLLCRGGPPLPRRLVTLSKQAVYAAAVALCHLRTVLKNACVARHESVPAAALLAATRALAAEARRLAGAPLVHDLAAAAPALLAAAMSGAPAAPQPPAAPGTSAAQPAARPAFQAGSGAAACTAGAAAAPPARPRRGARSRAAPPPARRRPPPRRRRAARAWGPRPRGRRAWAAAWAIARAGRCGEPALAGAAPPPAQVLRDLPPEVWHVMSSMASAAPAISACWPGGALLAG